MEVIIAKEIELYLRCKNCRRGTKGIEDFLSPKNGRKLKTCAKCRRDVKKGYANRKSNPPTFKIIVETFHELLNSEILKNMTDKQRKVVEFAEKKYVTEKILLMPIDEVKLNMETESRIAEIKNEKKQ